MESLKDQEDGRLRDDEGRFKKEEDYIPEGKEPEVFNVRHGLNNSPTPAEVNENIEEA
jgi:hypothetical protein